MKRFFGKTRRLSTQITLTLVALVLLTMAAAWLPEIWLIQDRFEQETWARVEQGRRAAQVLYGLEQSEVANSAILATQLPTLQQLVARRASGDLLNYMQTLEANLDLDAMLVCAPDGEVLSGLSAGLTDRVCQSEEVDGFWIVPDGAGPAVWIVAAQPILQDGQSLGVVVAGMALDDDFATKLRSETGLEHTILLDGQPVATSFQDGSSYWTAVERRQWYEAEADEENLRSTFWLDGDPYYATQLNLQGPAVQDEVSLAATGIFATRRTLLWTQVVSVGVVTLLGMLLGVFLARRLGRPLVQLAEEAKSSGKGDLAASFKVDSNVQEVRTLAEVLENARVELQQTLTSLQQEKAWIEQLLQAIVEGVVTLDDQGCITFFSQGAERIMGWPREEALGQSCDAIFHTPDTEAPFSELIPPPERRQRITVRTAGERTITLSVTRAQLTPPEADVAHLALVFRDVSDEEAFQRLMGHFLANVTHEFRTPLTALGASVELLLDQAQDVTQKELEQMLSWLHLGIVSLQTLVDNLLESASLEAGQFRVSPQPTELGEIIAEAVRLIHPMLKKYDQRLVVKLPPDIPVVQADSRRVVQVFINLLSNANRYGPEDSEVVIDARRRSDQVWIAVEDEGPGVPAEHRDDLFHRFSHFSAQDEKGKYGVGLGLWVVKAIVEEHGGEVGVEDRPGGGARFWFTLPIAEAS